MKTLWTERTWVFPRRMLTDIMALTLLSWGGFLITVMALVVAVSTFQTIDQSAWDIATGLPTFFAAFIGGYVAYDLLPRHVTHGQTRRDFAKQATVFIVIFSALLAVLMVAGFLLEWVLYRVADWSQELAGDQLYSSPTDVPLIFTEFWLTFLVWTSAGALIGAAWYRQETEGLIAIVIALIPISAIGIAFGSEWGPIGSLVDLAFDEPGQLSVPAAVTVGIVSFLVALAMTWPFVRDMPIRTKSS